MFYYAIIILCMLLTQSISGFLGVVIFILLALFLNAKNIISKVARAHKKLVPFLVPMVIALIAGGLIYYSIALSGHMRDHLLITIAPAVLFEVYQGADPPDLMLTQIVNIYPIFWIVQSLAEYNPLPFLFGGGLGAGSAVNNIFGGFGALTNPNANLIRVLVETGVVGLAFYVAAFYIPVRNITSTLSSAQRNAFCLFTILIISLQLGHRTACLYVYFGVLLATFEVMRKAGNINNQIETNG